MQKGESTYHEWSVKELLVGMVERAWELELKVKAEDMTEFLKSNLKLLTDEELLIINGQRE